MRALVTCLLFWSLSVACLFAKETEEFFTNVYVVPPGFLVGPVKPGWEPQGPFWEYRNSIPPDRPKSAKEILEDAGIVFTEGCSAIYNGSTSQLIVRNTEEQMERVEAYINSITRGVEKQIYLTFRVVELDETAEKAAREAGLDWVSRPPQITASNYVRTRALDSYETFLEHLTSPPKLPAATPSVSRAIAGVLTDPQYQVAIRRLSQLPGIDLLSCPSVMARSGQPALVQVDRFRVGAIAVLGADAFTIELSVFLPEPGEALFEPGDDLTTPFKVTIWDGQTIAAAMSREDGPLRLVFATAQILDPAGMPVNAGGGEQAAKLRERAGKAEKEDGPDPKEWKSSLPGGVMHLVKKGESLVSIAKAAGTSTGAIKEGNGLKSDIIQVGQLLLLSPDAPEKEAPVSLAEALQSIFIPTLDFQEQSFLETLGFIQRVLLAESDSGRFLSSPPGIVLEDSENFEDVKITLKLSRLPVNEALGHVTSLAGCRYRIEGNRILISRL